MISIELTGIKITPERVYTMTFHPTETKPLIFAGDKAGHLGVLDASQEKTVSAGIKNENSDNDEEEEEEEEEEDNDPDPAITTLKPHTATISSMHIHPSKPTVLYTASYDSSIRETDLEKGTSIEKYAPESIEDDDQPISSIDMVPNDPNCIYWTTLHGTFGRIDLRTSSNGNSNSPSKNLRRKSSNNNNNNNQKVVEFWQLSEKKIGGFSICPSQPHYLATASLDRFMRVWDLRKLDHDNPIPVGEHENRLSVSHAAFNSSGQIATSSYDDSLKIYDLGAKGLPSWSPGRQLSDVEMTPDSVVRHNCQTGRWVTMYVPPSSFILFWHHNMISI